MIQSDTEQAASGLRSPASANVALDAENACLELCSNHGFATGHGDTVADIIREIDAQIKKRFDRLESDLNECREFLEDQVDVVDGSYGEPAPNRAMQLVSMIDETLNGRPV